MIVEVTRTLNLVIPVTRLDGVKLYIHSTPIPSEIFENNFLVLSKTWSALTQHGLSAASGPSVAMLVLKQVAKETQRAPGVNWWDGSDGVGGNAGLLAEMTRLSNVSVPRKDGPGWETVPLQNAVDNGTVAADEAKEVLNALTFFTVSSHVAPRVDRERIVRGMAAIYELQVTSLSATEYATSLMTLTKDASTGENPPKV